MAVILLLNSLCYLWIQTLSAWILNSSFHVLTATSMNTLPAGVRSAGMRDEAEIREQYEFLQEQLDSEEMRHEGVRQMFTYYKRALGWVLEEEYI